jgi:hypothetical protein
VITGIDFECVQSHIEIQGAEIQALNMLWNNAAACIIVCGPTENCVRNGTNQKEGHSLALKLKAAGSSETSEIL